MVGEVILERILSALFDRGEYFLNKNMLKQNLKNSINQYFRNKLNKDTNPEWQDFNAYLNDRVFFLNTNGFNFFNFTISDDDLVRFIASKDIEILDQNIEIYLNNIKDFLVIDDNPLSQQVFEDVSNNIRSVVYDIEKFDFPKLTYIQIQNLRKENQNLNNRLAQLNQLLTKERLENSKRRFFLELIKDIQLPTCSAQQLKNLAKTQSSQTIKDGITNLISRNFKLLTLRKIAHLRQAFPEDFKSQINLPENIEAFSYMIMDYNNPDTLAIRNCMKQEWENRLVAQPPLYDPNFSQYLQQKLNNLIKSLFKNNYHKLLQNLTDYFCDNFLPSPKITNQASIYIRSLPQYQNLGPHKDILLPPTEVFTKNFSYIEGQPIIRFWNNFPSFRAGPPLIIQFALYDIPKGVYLKMAHMNTTGRNISTQTHILINDEPLIRNFYPTDHIVNGSPEIFYIPPHHLLSNESNRLIFSLNVPEANVWQIKQIDAFWEF